MSDQSPDDDRSWWTSAGGPAGEDPEVLTALAGRIDPVHPIGPLGLRARTRRPYVLVAVAVTALLGGAGAALVVTGSGVPVPAQNAAAAGPSPSTAPSAGLPGVAGPGSRSSSPGRITDPEVQYGQYVVRQPGGGYQTIDVQNGQVTAVNGTSVTLRSDDGFTRGYVVARSTVVDSGRDAIAAVKVGDEVSAQATVTGTTVTATSITDLTLLQHRGSALDRRRGTSGVSGAGTLASG